jgi:hypothetical protein
MPSRGPWWAKLRLRREAPKHLAGPIDQPRGGAPRASLLPCRTVSDPGVEPTNQRINIADLGDSIEDRYELRAELRRRIGNSSIARARTYTAIASILHEHFDDQSTSSELDDFCLKVLSKMEPTATQPARPPAERLVRCVFGLEEPPAQKREQLLEQALADLHEIEEHILNYENTAEVTAFRTGQRPSNDKGRVLTTFYERCREERAAITRYLASGLDAEAIRVCTEDYRFLRSFDFLSLRSPPPYRLRGPRADEYFDHRKINQWRHRVGFLPVSKAYELGALYEKDTATFYKELDNARTTVNLLDIIDSASHQIERLKERQAIFAEIRTLHDAKLWRALFALALPQVEGLFAEMGDLAAPSAPLLGALPAKVRFVRDYAASHEQSLDYFEFIVPMKRNHFSHTGKLNMPDLQAIDMLFDLAYVCEVYMDLEAPAIELTKLLAKLRSDPEASIRDWSRAFELLGKIDERNQRTDIAAPLENVLSLAFPTDVAKEASAEALAQRLANGLSELCDCVHRHAQQRLLIDLDLSKKLHKTALEQASNIMELIDDIEVLNEDLLEPIHVNQVITGLLHAVTFPPDAQKKLTAALGAGKTILNNLDRIARRGKKAILR